jgi:CBS domain-containing protein
MATTVRTSRKKILRARDLMSPPLVSIAADQTLREAAVKMVQARVSSLLIEPAEREEPYGVVTTKDLVDAIAEDADPDRVTVHDVGNLPLLMITPGVPITYVARAMHKFGLRHIAVFDGRSVVGMLSNLDLVQAMADGSFSTKVGRPMPGSRR